MTESYLEARYLKVNLVPAGTKDFLMEVHEPQLRDLTPKRLSTLRSTMDEKTPALSLVLIGRTKEERMGAGDKGIYWYSPEQLSNMKQW